MYHFKHAIFKKKENEQIIMPGLFINLDFNKIVRAMFK